MQFNTLSELKRAGSKAVGPGPVALIFAEDAVAVSETLKHHLDLGFDRVILFSPPGLETSVDNPRISTVTYRTSEAEAVPNAVNTVIDIAAEGTWLYYGYNAEFLFFPFCDSRVINEMLAFHVEERRAAMITFVVDLYAPDLGTSDLGVSIGAAHLDSAGYYSLARKDPANDWKPKARQLDFYGGLRWRFEQHVPYEERRIDRIGLFRATSGLRLLKDGRLNVEEMNTYSCPWHNNLSAAVCSFRAAKALRSNPGSRAEIDGFLWPKSVPFDWTPGQLMDLGLMEPGQWF